MLHNEHKITDCEASLSLSLSLSRARSLYVYMLVEQRKLSYLRSKFDQVLPSSHTWPSSVPGVRLRVRVRHARVRTHSPTSSKFPVRIFSLLQSI